ncbi:MAG: hypothetical protein JKY98_08550 [Gammaproteobacteria bacterium]|nr:hypothetical protein [Gammaproteobacteria bacterium]
MTAKIRAFIQVLILCIWCQPGYSADLERLGSIQFATTATEAAQEHFLAGVYYLHNFGWNQARIEFQRAQTLDANFAMAYWGESLTYNHPLYPQQDTDSPSRVLKKLGFNSSERLRKAPSELEKGFLRAAEAYAFSEGSSKQRRLTYHQSMQELYEKYPEHAEVRAFYALSLLSIATDFPGEQRKRIRRQAGEIANKLFQENDRHPGAIHYLIHSHDDPDNAYLALDAANKYVEIAPLIAHARHMPSHIYIHMGRWYEVADLNETAFYTARAMWRPGDDPTVQNHILEFGQYGDLQLANYNTAERWIERAEDTLRQDPANRAIAVMLERLKARLIIESRRWQYAPADPTKTDDQLFAIGLSAINMKNLSLSREANQILKERVSENLENIPLHIAQLELEASILAAAGETDDALKIINSAIELTRKHPASSPLPAPLKPVHELKGEMLLRAKRFPAALNAFQRSLAATPFRPWSILGLARSHAALDNNIQASEYYRQLLNTWEDNSLLGVSEARTHLTKYPAEDSAKPGEN